MCETDQNSAAAAPSTPGALTFDTIVEFLAAIEPGMDLCTSDFTAWATVEEVRSDAAVVRGRRRRDDRPIEVPAAALIDIRGGHCVRIDRVQATIDAQGWEVG